MAIQAAPFGRDTSCAGRFRFGRVVSGQRLVVEAALRRLTTTRGTLLDDPTYGLALVDLLNSELSPQQEAAIPGRIRNELLKDDRVESVEVKITKTREGASLTFFVEITITTALGPFDLSIAITDVTLEVLTLPEAA